MTASTSRQTHIWGVSCLFVTCLLFLLLLRTHSRRASEYISTSWPSSILSWSLSACLTFLPCVIPVGFSLEVETWNRVETGHRRQSVCGVIVLKQGVCARPHLDFFSCPSLTSSAPNNVRCDPPPPRWVDTLISKITGSAQLSRPQEDIKTGTLDYEYTSYT